MTQPISRNKPVFDKPRVAEALRAFTGARIGVGRCGARPLTQDVLQFRIDHAAARDAVWKDVSPQAIARHHCVCVQTQVPDKQTYLLRPDLGRRIRTQDVEILKQSGPAGHDVLLLIGDGLSADAIEANLDDLVPSVRTGLQTFGYQAGRPVFIKHARVGVMDHIGEILEPQTVALLIGERPGLITSESVSAYLCYRPRPGKTDADRNVISNIHRSGLPPPEAGAVIADFIDKMLRAKRSGVGFEG